MNKVKLTVITVCYNAAELLPKTLESIRSQSRQDFEYLIIDGASSDDSLEIIKKSGVSARIYSEPDRGIYDAMNKGLALAQGHYVWFMNAGDQFFDRDSVSSVLQQIEEQSPDIIYGDTMIVDKLGVEQGLRRLRPPQRLERRSFLEGMLVCHQAFVVRRSLAPEYDLRYKLSADYDWTIKCIEKASSMVYLSAPPLARYLNEGATSRNHLKSLMERYRIMAKHYGYIRASLRHLKFLFVRRR